MLQSCSCHDPEISLPVFCNLGNLCSVKPVLMVDEIDPAVPEPGDPSLPESRIAKPDCTGVVFEDRAAKDSWNLMGRTEIDEIAPVVPCEARLGAEPEVATPILNDRGNTAVRETILRALVLEEKRLRMQVRWKDTGERAECDEPGRRGAMREQCAMGIVQTDV
jgi:hypothetical protein